MVSGDALLTYDDLVPAALVKPNRGLDLDLAQRAADFAVAACAEVGLHVSTYYDGDNFRVLGASNRNAVLQRARRLAFDTFGVPYEMRPLREAYT